MSDSKENVATLFVEDGLLFTVTFPSLVYFFGLQEVILLLSVHALSIPCAGLAYGSFRHRDDFVSFLVGLTSVLTNVADLAAVLFCSCQVFRFDFCCDFLNTFGVGCPSALRLPTVFFIFPVSLYNLACGLGRTSVAFLSASSASREVIRTAFLVVSYVAYAFILLVPDKDSPSNLLVLLVCYITLSLFASVIFLRHSPNIGTTNALLPSIVILALQGYLSLRHRYPGVYMILPLCGVVLCVSSALRAVPGIDAWSRMYGWVASAAGALVFVIAFDDLRPVVGTTYVAYFCSFAGRVVLFGLDSHYLSLLFSVLLCLIDVVFATYVLVWCDDTTPLLLWVLVLTFFSACVSVSTLVSRVYDLKQVEDSLRKNISTVVDVEKVDVPSFGAPRDPKKLLDAYETGREAGAVALKELSDGRLDSRDVESFLEVLQVKDSMKLSDPTAVRTTRMRICFAKGVFAELSDVLGEDQNAALQSKYLWTLGVPRRLYLNFTQKSGSDCSRSIDGLDVGWAPGEDDEASQRLSLSRLIGLRASATRELKVSRGENLQRQVETRYRFVAGTVSFKTANKVARYEKNWDIVWT